MLTGSEKLSASDFGRLSFPPVLALFAKRMGALYMGPDAYDSYFRVFALPLVSGLVGPPHGVSFSCARRHPAVVENP